MKRRVVYIAVITALLAGLMVIPAQAKVKDVIEQSPADGLSWMVVIPTEIEVAVDIKPRSCPNPLNTGKRGVLPVAILGTAGFDVTQVDPATVLLEGVAPLRWNIKDVAAPYTGGFSDPVGCKECTEEGPDGFLDLTLKFNAQEVVAALGDVSDGQCLLVQLTGNLKAEFGGTAIVGEDVVRIILKTGGKKK